MSGTQLSVESEEGLLDSTEKGVETVGTPLSLSIEENYSRNDWCKLLFQDGYLKVLKQFALSGELQRSNIRAICWKLFLGCLPEDQNQWLEACKQSREAYRLLKDKYIKDPHSDETSLDVTVNNPLSLDEESPWNQYFQDSSLKQTITQDIVRTHPDQIFFRQDVIQTAMLNILFCYAKENLDVGYRQGMHELLAPILFVLHAEIRDDVDNDETLRPELKVVMDPVYIEADAYCLFSELMEGMQQFYLNAMLEADFYIARERNGGQQAMKYDPRVSTPFESKDLLPSTSAIARKLDKIHEVLLKRADEQLYYRLQDLGIPPQTYGIRWIRLLFGREFHLPCVLQLWDALFAEGTSLALMDYVFITMLMQIRETLLTGDYSACMQLLMRYPTVYEVSDLVQKALHLRNPIQYPNPISHVREWAQLNNDVVHEQHPLQIQLHPPEGVKRSQKFADKTKQVFATATKQMQIQTKQIHLPTKLSSSKHKEMSGKEKIPQPLGDVNTTSSMSDSYNSEQEMVRNPKTRPIASGEIEMIKEQLENTEAKCLYCGRKMESILEELQLHVEVMTLTTENEDAVYLGLAGLKQIRDLLLHKLPFSGELPDYETLTTPPPNNQIPHPFSYPEPTTNEVYEVIENTEDGPSSQVDNEP